MDEKAARQNANGAFDDAHVLIEYVRRNSGIFQQCFNIGKQNRIVCPRSSSIGSRGFAPGIFKTLMAAARYHNRARRPGLFVPSLLPIVAGRE